MKTTFLNLVPVGSVPVPLVVTVYAPIAPAPNVAVEVPEAPAIEVGA